MQWNFPVDPGTPVTVRLYFANQCGCTAAPGARVFDVAIDGTTVLGSFDMVASQGDRVAFMESFNLAADADGIDIDFGHLVENPLINGIEILDRSVPGGTVIDPSVDEVDRTPLSASGVPGATTTVAGNDAYHNARGAFVINGTLYPWADGTLKARTVTGSTLGVSRVVNLFSGTFASDAPNVTGIVYEPATCRVCYTMFGDGRLFWRWFNAESEIMGAVRHEADAGSIDASQVRGMFLSGGFLYYAQRSTGDLWRVGFDAGVPGAFGPGVTGSPLLVDSSRDWVAPGMTLSAP